VKTDGHPRIRPFFGNAGGKLTLILALAALLRFWGLGVKQLWLDEILQAMHSKADSLQAILAGVAQDRGSAPLDYIIQHFFIRGAGEDIQWFARVHAALFGIAAVWLVYLVCRELLENERLSLMCALLFCVYPLHHHYSQEGRPYSLFVLLVLCSYLAFLRWIKKPGWRRWTLLTLLSIAVYYTHPYMSLVLVGQFLFIVYRQILIREETRIFFRRTAAFLLSGILASVAFLPWLRYSFYNAQGTVAEPINLRLFLRIIKELADGSYPLALVLIICLAAGILCLYKTGRSLQLGMLLIWILSPIPLVLILLTWRNYFFAVRQLIFISPALFVLAVAGIDFLKRKVARKYFLPEALIILMSVVVILLHYPDKRDDLVSASRFLESSVRTNDVIVAPGSANILAFYFPDIHRYTLQGVSPNDLETKTGSSRIFCVKTNFDQDHDALDRLLARDGGARQVKSFRGITVYVFPRAGPANPSAR
jgi:uncharacterized membrane protein